MSGPLSMSSETPGSSMPLYKRKSILWTISPRNLITHFQNNLNEHHGIIEKFSCTNLLGYYGLKTQPLSPGSLIQFLHEYFSFFISSKSLLWCLSSRILNQLILSIMPQKTSTYSAVFKRLFLISRFTLLRRFMIASEIFHDEW